MTKDEAIAWAVKNLAEAFDYEFYQERDKAEYAAEAMTALDVKPWQVVEAQRRGAWAVQPKPD